MSAAPRSEAGAGPLTRALRTVGAFLLRVPWPLALVLVLLWAAVIFDLSSQAVPMPAGPSLVWEFLSNFAHAPLFGLLALFVAALVLRERGGGWPRPSPARAFLVLALVGGYGVADELHQARVPGRHASPFDVVTDVASAVAVVWIVRTLGTPGLAERTLLARLALGALLCVLSAALALLS